MVNFSIAMLVYQRVDHIPYLPRFQVLALKHLKQLQQSVMGIPSGLHSPQNVMAYGNHGPLKDDFVYGDVLYWCYGDITVVYDSAMVILVWCV